MTHLFPDLPAPIRTYATTHGFADAIAHIAQRKAAVTLTVPSQHVVYRFVAHQGNFASMLAHELCNITVAQQHGIATPRLKHRDVIIGYDVLRFGYIAGEVVGSNATANQTAQLGTHLRLLHDRCADAGQQVSNQVDALYFCEAIFDDAHTHEYTASQRAQAAQVVAQFQALRAGSAAPTLIHSDCHFNNIVFHGDTMTLIDWAECGWGSRYLDIGVAIHAITYHKERTRDNLRAFLHGYFGQHNISNHEHVLIDAFVRQRFLEGMTWHLDDPPEVQATEYADNRTWIATCLHNAQTFTLASWLDMSV